MDGMGWYRVLIRPKKCMFSEYYLKYSLKEKHSNHEIKHYQSWLIKSLQPCQLCSASAVSITIHTISILDTLPQCPGAPFHGTQLLKKMIYWTLILEKFCGISMKWHSFKITFHNNSMTLLLEWHYQQHGPFCLSDISMTFFIKFPTGCTAKWKVKVRIVWRNKI